MEHTCVIDTKVGRLAVTVSENTLTAIRFTQASLVEPQSAFSQSVVTQLHRYFDDPAYAFDVPFVELGTPFQQAVWRILRKIPVGETLTYTDVANELGSSPRAVGNACRANPLCVVTPCHRVVGKKGLGGFSGDKTGALIKIKSRLLAHEGATLH